jgi:hypothetical protein
MLPLHEDTTHGIIGGVGAYHELGIWVVELGGGKDRCLVQVVDSCLPRLVDVLLFILVECLYR